MKILLTGGAGFIGRRLARAYLAAGHQVAVVDDLSHGRAERLPEGVRLHRLDIRDLPSLKGAIGFERPDVVNHHAALVSVRQSASHPDAYAAVNFEGTQRVLEAVAESSVPKLIFASSGGAVYGEARDLPVDEGHPLAPLSPYGRSKADAERAILEAPGQFERVILRYGNVYGPGQDPREGNGAVAIFARQLLEGEPISIFGDGKQLRDYVYVDDVARANLRALESGANGVFNIGTGRGLSLLQLIETLASALGLAPRWVRQAAHPFEVKDNVLDCSAAQARLGWRAEVEFEVGAARTLEAMAIEREKHEPGMGSSPNGHRPSAVWDAPDLPSETEMDPRHV